MEEERPNLRPRLNKALREIERLKEALDFARRCESEHGAIDWDMVDALVDWSILLDDDVAHLDDSYEVVLGSESGPMTVVEIERG